MCPNLSLEYHNTTYILTVVISLILPPVIFHETITFTEHKGVIVATPLVIAFEMFLCVYLESIQVRSDYIE